MDSGEHATSKNWYAKSVDRLNKEKKKKIFNQSITLKLVR